MPAPIIFYIGGKTMTLMDVAHDFAVVSILLAIGYFLRMKVKLFQRLFLPASIIGGLVGLIIGPQILGLYSPVYVTYTDSINEWSGVLLAKVVDPDHKTVAAETVAASCTLGYSYSLPYLLIMPMLIIRNPKLVFGISVVLLFVFLIAGEIFRKKEAVSN